MNKALRTSGLPWPVLAWPLFFPLSCVWGARPTRAAICFPPVGIEQGEANASICLTLSFEDGLGARLLDRFAGARDDPGLIQPHDAEPASRSGTCSWSY
ncbi:MAG TPA: hypothetical protein VLI91_05385, partial [Roseiarcus sp.]|nr:hypothetical protein [Roseiarcus sp.]